MDKLLKKIDSMEPGERDHLRQLLRERKKTEEGGKMDWMYKEGKPDEEDYLLGRRIDKYVDDEKEKKEAVAKDAPGATFSEVIAKRADLDMQTKMREDPLYAIRKKEEEARRRLLENPMKMKQLQKALQKRKEEEKKRKKKKKKEKKHRKKHRGSDDSDSDSSEDDEVFKKYMAILASKKQKTSSKTAERQKPLSSDTSDGESKVDAEKSKSELVEELRQHISQDSDDDDDTRRVRQPHAYGLLLKEGQEPRTSKRASKSRSKSPKRLKKSRSRSPKRSRKSRSRSKSPRRSDRRSRSPRSSDRRSRSPRRSARRSRSPRSSDRRSRSPRRSARRSRSPRSVSPRRKRYSSPVRQRSRSPARRRSKSPGKRSSTKPVSVKKKMTAEEMERKRQEMMEDAKLRDQQRTSNIARYRKEDAAEKEQLQKHMDKEAKFLNPILSEHAGHSSVEDRLKRNRYSLQRTKVQMDRAFTKQ